MDQPGDEEMTDHVRKNTAVLACAGGQCNGLIFLFSFKQNLVIAIVTRVGALKSSCNTILTIRVQCTCLSSHQTNK